MGGGIGMGNTCKPMAVSFQCMTKFTTNKKKKKEKKKKDNYFLISSFRDIFSDFKILSMFIFVHSFIYSAYIY